MFLLRNCLILDHIQCSADQIPIPIRQIRVIPRHQRLEAEAAILPERNLAQQKIAQHIRRKQIALALRALRKLLAVHVLAEGLENRLRPHDVALDFDIFALSKSSQPCAVIALGSGSPAASRNAGQ